MTWKTVFPEGSTVFIGGVPYLAGHNPHFPGIDLFKDGERVMTVAPDILPKIANGVRYAKAS